MTGYTYRGTTKNDTSLVCGDKKGEIAGYGRHVRNGERPCSRCREAMNTYNRGRRRKWESKSTTKAADQMRRKARARAWAALQRLHPGQYQALYLHELAALHQEAKAS